VPKMPSPSSAWYDRRHADQLPRTGLRGAHPRSCDPKHL